MVSLDLDQALAWLYETDGLRQRLQLQALVSRPVRVWMYDKASIVSPHYRGHHMAANCSQSRYDNQVNLAEHIVQERFQSSPFMENPLLAGCFLIPQDLYCFIHFDQLPDNFSNAQFRVHASSYSQNYFDPLLNSVRREFPYWTMNDQPGANHIIVFVGGREHGCPR